MAEQDWIMAGVYLAGLMSSALVMGVLATHAAKTRHAAAKALRRPGK
ncbi:hypothetical protein VOM14_07660 [Paraburkholderia sp. MPAMCS5]|nr:hypothetical protein [Paraburkholderia sp. MPAMCS5]